MKARINMCGSYERESKALGNFSNSKGIDTGLVLTASKPVDKEDPEEE